MTFSLAFYLTNLWWIAAGILLMLNLAGELGWRIGRIERGESAGFRSLVGNIATAILGFLGLLLGFSLSMTINRFDARRDVIVNEANAIGTLWLRAGLLEAPLQAELRTALQDYTDARLGLTRVGDDLGKVREARARSAAAQRAIWSVVQRTAATEQRPAVVSLVVSAANDVIDLDELRISSLENYVPAPIVLLLVAVAAVALAFLGWSFGAAGQRSYGSMVLISLLLTTVLAVMMDFNRPHRGFIRVSDQSLVRLQRMMDAPAAP
jgi:hypothetical protein